MRTTAFLCMAVIQRSQKDPSGVKRTKLGEEIKKDEKSMIGNE